MKEGDQEPEKNESVIFRVVRVWVKEVRRSAVRSSSPSSSNDEGLVTRA